VAPSKANCLREKKLMEKDKKKSGGQPQRIGQKKKVRRGEAIAFPVKQNRM